VSKPSHFLRALTAAVFSRKHTAAPDTSHSLFHPAVAGGATQMRIA
jgi:hypothetical protein